LSAVLTGAAEVPGPGDPDGSGTATLTVNPGLATICSAATVSGIAPATAAHIHLGAVGVAGPIVVGLTPPTDGSPAVVWPVDRATRLRIWCSAPKELDGDVRDLPDGAEVAVLSVYVNGDPVARTLGPSAAGSLAPDREAHAG